MMRNVLLVISFIFASVNVFATATDKDAHKDTAQIEKKDEANVENAAEVKKDKKEEKK